jgi:glucose-6-phosphate 1-dehydrogenase
MASTTSPPAEAAAAPKRGGSTRPADVFVAFGTTGDLAKAMTFRSLYRLEQRGLLDSPIVGVAANDWSVDDLRNRARAPVFYLEIPHGHWHEPWVGS